METDTDEVEAPVAEAVLGEAEATVIESGGTDASSEFTEAVDNSVNVTVEAPESSEPAGVPEHDHPHEHEHVHISACPECMAAVAAVSTTQAEAAIEEEIEAEAEAELPPPEEPAEAAAEDTPPQRTHLFHRKLF